MRTRLTAEPATLRPIPDETITVSPVRPLRVGIPRAMGFYEHGSIWARMFERLGCKVVLSPPTDRGILDEGVRATATEFCLPVKVLAGHVRALCKKVDVIFIPRYFSSAVNEMGCPKACALPDVVRLEREQPVEILEADIDPDRFTGESQAVDLRSIAERLKIDGQTVRDALLQAKRECSPQQNVTLPGRTIALLGHPYVLEDPCISMQLAEKLRQRGFHTVMPRNLPVTERRADVHPYDGKAFYTIGLDILGAAHALARRKEVRGMIYLTPFGCGIDALAAAHVEQHLRAERMPFMKLTVDEQTGEAGFDTRLEAFLDMIGE